MHAARFLYAPQFGQTSLALAHARPFVAVSIHDCYAPHWLHDYPHLLDALQRLAPLVTLDEIAWTRVLQCGV